MAGQPRWNGTLNGGSTGGSRRTRLLRLLHPGIRLKRWLGLGALGVSIFALGLAFLLRRFFDLHFPNMLPPYAEGALVVLAGLGVSWIALYGLYRSIGPLILAEETIDDLAETIYLRRSRERGPRIVVLGGGTGLSMLLRGLKAYTDNLTAIVTVADDGGSSGRLRRELGVPPPGDFRNCLVALSDDESLLADLFQYRFDQGDGLEGHSFGNLFIAAMSHVTGSFEAAIQESSRVLAIHGQIVPATVESLTLRARLKDGTEVRGESTIGAIGGNIERLYLEPAAPAPFSPALKAIEEAQLIVIGPGSLYTSILPNLLVSGIGEAIRQSGAASAYVCNVATQTGETDSYTVADHVEALQTHTSRSIVDFVVANNAEQELRPRFTGQPVLPDGRAISHATLVQGDLIDRDHPVRHDTDKLAKILIDILQQRRKRGELRSTASQ